MQNASELYSSTFDLLAAFKLHKNLAESRDSFTRPINSLISLFFVTACTSLRYMFRCRGNLFQFLNHADYFRFRRLFREIVCFLVLFHVYVPLLEKSEQIFSCGWKSMWSFLRLLWRVLRLRRCICLWLLLRLLWRVLCGV